MMSRVVIVTGGFGVLGQAVSEAFAARGDKVARIDFAASAAKTIDGTLDIGGIDLSDSAQATRCVAGVVAELGTPTVLVNIAGGFAWETVADGDIGTWSRMFALNAQTCLNMTKAALPDLMRATSAGIINVGAMGALTAAAGMGSYAASKSAVHRLTETLAAELVDRDISVNAILPTIIDTPTNRRDMPDADFDSWVRPEAIADVILFLASPARRAINGALIPVSRGGV